MENCQQVSKDGACLADDDIIPVPELERVHISHAELLFKANGDEELIMTINDGSKAVVSITQGTPPHKAILELKFDDRPS